MIHCLVHNCKFSLLCHQNCVFVILLMQDKQNLFDIIQMYHQLKARQLSVQSDANSLITYPEYILPYLVHALAHNSCPNVDDCEDVGAYDDIYRYHLTHTRHLYAGCNDALFGYSFNSV